MEENLQKSSSKMNPMMIAGVVGVLLIVGVVVVMSMNGNNSSTTKESDTAMVKNNENEEMTESNEEAMMEGDEMMESTDEAMMEGDENAMMMEETIQVEGGAYYFDPDEIRVKAGEEVTITLNSVDMMHDFVVDELDIRTEVLPGGESGSVTFTPTKPGEYEFYCSVGNHKAQGMVGTLIVE